MIALPGDELAVLEEFEAGSGAYPDYATIRAEQLGQPVFDMTKRMVSVRPLKSAQTRMPKVGDYVTGLVESAQSSVVNVRILSINNVSSDNGFTGMVMLHNERSFDGSKRGGYREGRGRGSRDRDDDRDRDERPRRTVVCKTADIVKARVVSTLNSIIHLSFDGDDLGVVAASCSNCGSPMLRVHDKAKCPECGNIEERKLALDFGKTR
jgi:exosome complex component CSL4